MAAAVLSFYLTIVPSPTGIDVLVRHSLLLLPNAASGLHVCSRKIQLITHTYIVIPTIPARSSK